ncbi:nudix hydrolase [Aaosphaeria arxii CBS 175.79]|uniref:Nudix hydrolase n=1 Tax=Aaosphaeria arxii CBS 175.79 TaxID=1450172 RepID=A0A6A5XRF1_9PLEO|nr:nudix hydrolase [Aaosphaeria arxii CBS 175.79]KAF2015513.1 nudix hydrolase [Aaosphaeria arxii CBS 175.79]
MSTSTFTLPRSNPPCKVALPDNLTQEQLLEFPAFKDWISTLQHTLALQERSDHTFHRDPYRLRQIDVQAADWFGPKHLGFVKLQAKITTDNGEWVPGAVFLRGGSVGMLIILQPDDIPEGSEKDKKVILTVQPRIAAGSLALAEIPAGMLDGGKLAGKAAEEIKEETGLEVHENELINMSELAISRASTNLWKAQGANQRGSSPDAKEELKNAMYPSPGACDEFLPLFLCQKRLPRKELETLGGKLTGLRNEGEKITLKLVPLEDVWIEGGRDAKALAALALYEGLRREKRL